MTGWIVANTSSCGLRRMFSRLRHAIVMRVADGVTAVDARRGALGWVAATVVMTLRRSRRRRLVVCPVSSRNTSSSVGSRRTIVAGSRCSPSRIAHRFEHRSGARAAGDVDTDELAVARDGADGRDAPRRRVPRRPRRGIVISMTVEPSRSFSSVAVPSAMTLPWSITTMLSASTSASSRYCVVSSTVVPPRHEVLDHSPQLVATLRVEAGGGLVEEEHRRPVHQRGGEVEPAAHATGVGARRCGRPRASSANCSSSSWARASISSLSAGA